MQLMGMKHMLEMGWNFDYVTNISESDFPVRPIRMFEELLKNNYGGNFIAIGRDDMTKFQDGQGMRKTFYTCDNHMFRIGDRWVE